jgi:putative membrane protein
MSSRNLKQYTLIALKGVAMGAADAVPGVSGGTIAFISGIYEELITTIGNVNFSLISTLRKQGFMAFWKQLNGGFLLALLSGIILSFVSFMRLAKYLLEHHPILIWSFFFGLIIASIIYVGKQIKKWSLVAIIALIMGAAIAYFITTLASLGSNENSYFLFFAGAIAICAMILPGISGSFILVILGAYKTLSDAIHDLDIKKLLLFTAGAVVGLLSFSKLLKWLFKHHENTTLALLTGFIIGSLNKIWPWKETVTVFSKESGLVGPLSDHSQMGTLTIHQQTIGDFESLKVALEKSVSPSFYSEINNGADPQVLYAVLFTVIGFLTIFILERLATVKKNS